MRRQDYVNTMISSNRLPHINQQWLVNYIRPMTNSHTIFTVSQQHNGDSTGHSSTGLNQYNWLSWKLLFDKRDRLISNTNILSHIGTINNNAFTNKVHSNQFTDTYQLQLIQQSNTITQLLYTLLSSNSTTISCINLLTTLNKLVQLIQSHSATNKQLSIAQVHSCVTLIEPLLYNTLNTYIFQSNVAQCLLPDHTDHTNTFVTLLCRCIYSIGVLHNISIHFNSTTNLLKLSDTLLIYIEQLLLFNKLNHSNVALLLTGLQLTGILHSTQYTHSKFRDVLLSSTVTQLYGYEIDCYSITIYCNIFSKYSIHDKQLWQLIYKHLTTNEIIMKLSMAQLSSIIHSLSYVGTYNVTDKAILITILCDRFMHNTQLFNQLTVPQLANIVHSLPKYHTRHRVIKQLILNITRVLIQYHQNQSYVPPNYNSPLQQLHNNVYRTLMLTCVVSCELGIYNSTIWSYLCNHMTVDDIVKIDTHTLCNMVWCCMELCIDIHGIDRVLLHIIQQLKIRVVDDNRRKGMNNTTFIRILLGLIMRLNQLQVQSSHNKSLSDVQLTQHINYCNVLIQAMVEHINYNLDSIQFTTEQYQQLQLVHLSLQLHQKLLVQFTPELQQLCYESCTKTSLSYNQHQLQDHLYKRLNRSGIDYEYNVLNESTGFYIDAIISKSLIQSSVNHHHQYHHTDNNTGAAISDYIDDIAMLVVNKQSYCHIIGVDAKQRYSSDKRLLGSIVLKHRLIELIGGYRINIVPYYSLTNHTYTQQPTPLTQYELSALTLDI